MPHTFTSPERTTVSGATLNVYVKLEITDPDGTWKDVSTGLGTPDWLNSVTISDNIDSNSCSMSASLLRDAGTTLSLAPLREDSTVNRNAAAVYAPMLDLVRMWRTSVAVVGHGVTPIAGDFNEIGKGYIDTIDVDDQSPTIQLTGRGEEAPLIDAEILDVRDYVAQTMEVRLQAVLADNWDTVKFGTVPTIYTPVPMDFAFDAESVAFGNLMSRMQQDAALNGAVIRYRYDSAGLNRLTLFFPDREAVPGDEDWTIASTEYLRIPLNRLDISGVRNLISVRYSTGTTQVVVFSPPTGTSASLTRYGRRPLPIDLGEDAQILTYAQAQGLADAIRSDLEFPALQQRFETYAFWFVQLCDYGKMTANAVHYDQDQYGGVIGYTHDLSNGTLRTAVDLGAQPSGGYRKWIPIARNRRLRPPGGPIGDPLLPPFVPSPTLTGLTAWYDASTLGYGDNFVMDTWDDLMENYQAFTGISAQRPMYDTPAQNGLGAVYFDGTDDRVSSGANVGLDGLFTIYVVCKRDTAGGSYPMRMVDWDNGAGNRLGQFRYTSSSNLEAIAFNDGGADFSTTKSGITTDAWQVLTMVRRATAVQAYAGGVGGTATTTTGTPKGTAAVPEFGIGSGEIGDRFKGYIGEVRMYPVAHSDTDRQSVENELAAKWGITL